jgi:hypothetical protein
MEKKGLISFLIATGVLVIAGGYSVLFVYAPGTLMLLSVVIWLVSFVAWAYLKKKWLKISWMIAGGTVVSIVLWVVLAVVLFGPGV